MSLDKWKANNIFKDVLDEFKASVVVNMQYGSTQIHDGDEMRPAKCADAPSVVFKGQAEKKYTVIMTDPDPPSPTDPKFREWLHWIVVNIPGEKGDVTSGKTVVEYNPPAPPRGTHRYVLIILEQSGEVHAQAPKERKFFKTKTFAKDHSLTPVGGIFYVAQP